MHNRYSDLISEDSGLTALGWQQTDALAAWLKSHYEIETLVSAPQLRNRLTAQRIGQAIGLPVTVHQGLPVRGNQAAPTATEALMRQLMQQMRQEQTREERGEARNPIDSDLCHETLQVLGQLQREHPGETIAIVMGAAMISATVACLFRADSLAIRVDHTSVTELRLTQGHWTICCVNRREHIPLPAKHPAPLAPDSNEPPEDVNRLIQVYNQAAAARIDPANPKRRARVQDFIRFARLGVGLQVLDIGAGSGVLALAVAEAGAKEVVGVDVSPAMLEKAEYLRLSSAPEVAKRVDFRLAMAQALPFRDERFDAVVCRMMLHLSRKPEHILRDVVRVLRPGGIFVMADVLSVDDPVRRATQNAIEERRNPAHVAARSIQQYRDLITGVGLRVEAEEVVTFERELEEWLAEMAADAAVTATVRDMFEAGLETDAAGMHARRQGEKLVFDQRLFYLRALKE